MRIAVYPGSFDPITNGHLDILKRAYQLFDKIILLVADNSNKNCVFSVDERVAMAKEAVKDYPNVVVDSSSGLTVAYAKEHGAKVLIRGLRVVSDFEYELQLAKTNEFIDRDVDCIYFMTHSETSFISSSI